jgi:hypothetical protein
LASLEALIGGTMGLLFAMAAKLSFAASRDHQILQDLGLQRAIPGRMSR